MLEFIFALICLVVAAWAAIALKTYAAVPPRELKRRAGNGEEPAVTLWRAVSYGPALNALLWLIIIIGLALGLVLLARVAPLALAVLAVGVIAMFWLAWLPNGRHTSWGVRLGIWAAAPMAWLAGKLYPVLAMLARWSVRFAAASHTGLFERADLLEIMEKQKQQADNRLSEDELNMAMASLQFGDKHVSDVMTARSKVKSVAANDKIRPGLLDELHKTRHSHFPVYGSKRDDFIGVLRLPDLLVNAMHHDGRAVSDAIQPQVSYLNANDDLLTALHEFYRTKQQLFIVINNHNEYVGIITLKDIIEQLVGEQLVELADAPPSRTEVAQRHQAVKAKPVDEAPAETPSDEPEADKE